MTSASAEAARITFENAGMAVLTGLPVWFITDIPVLATASLIFGALSWVEIESIGA